MPIPPPPALAFTRIGYLIYSHCFSNSSLDKAEGLLMPGHIGTFAFFAKSNAVVLFPMSLIF